jgi:hypothetical protein
MHEPAPYSIVNPSDHSCCLPPHPRCTQRAQSRAAGVPTTQDAPSCGVEYAAGPVPGTGDGAFRPPGETSNNPAKTRGAPLAKTTSDFQGGDIKGDIKGVGGSSGGLEDVGYGRYACAGWTSPAISLVGKLIKRNKQGSLAVFSGASSAHRAEAPHDAAWLRHDAAPRVSQKRAALPGTAG